MRLAQLVELAQRDLVHHAGLVLPLGHVVHVIKEGGWGFASQFTAFCRRSSSSFGSRRGSDLSAATTRWSGLRPARYLANFPQHP